MDSKVTNGESRDKTPVSVAKTWTEAEAEALAARFDATERQPRPLSGRELVQTRLMPSIKRKLRAGWSYDEIRDALAKLGVDIAKSTLKDYVKQASRPSGATKKPSSRSRPLQQTDGARSALDAGNQTAQ